MFITAFSTFAITRSYYKMQGFLDASYPAVTASNSNTQSELILKRLGGYSYVKPLLYADINNESGHFNITKASLKDIIDNHKLAGNLLNASVYIKDFTDGDFMCINDQEKYKSGSLVLLPVLITYLKMGEDNPSLLSKEVSFNTPVSRKHHYSNDTIKPGKKYSIKSLLRYMVVEEDENATQLLLENLDWVAFQKTFADMGLKAPEKNSAYDYSISARDYSLFFRSLYNATYLTINDSEFATELLAMGSNKALLSNGIPATTKFANSEGTIEGENNERQVHESAIIYVNDTPYMITIMTKGTDTKMLSKVISDLSMEAYTLMIAKNG